MVRQFDVLISARYWPFFVTQFFGAVNDNLLKASFAVIAAYGLWGQPFIAPELLVTLAAAIFILPFIICAPLAGHLADSYDKAKIVKILKLCEVAIVCFAMLSLFAQSFIFALLMLFLLGAQSAFFSPVKYSILAQHLTHEELLAGNGLLSTGTYIAVLMGTILGTVLAPLSAGAYILSGLLLFFSAIGLLCSFKVGAAPPHANETLPRFSLYQNVAGMFRYALKMPFGVLPALLSVSWFYFVASTFHAQFPNFARFILNVDTLVLSLFMILFACGIALGGLLNNVLLRSQISTRLVPLAGVLICCFSLDLYAASLHFPRQAGAEMHLAAFIQHWQGWRIMFDLLGVSLSGGLFIVPLRALIQERTYLSHRARIAALSSMSDALFILFSSLVSAILLWAGWSILSIFALCGGLTLFVAGFIYRHKGMSAVLDHVIREKE